MDVLRIHPLDDEKDPLISSQPIELLADPIVNVIKNRRFPAISCKFPILARTRQVRAVLASDIDFVCMVLHRKRRRYTIAAQTPAISDDLVIYLPECVKHLLRSES